MSSSERPPLVGVSACRIEQDGIAFHRVASKYVEAALVGAGALPLVIPALGPRLRGEFDASSDRGEGGSASGKPDLGALLASLDGLLITGSPSNVEPHHYDGPPPPAESARDPARDATTLPLIQLAIARAVPLFAICRGIQELNVALGGTLHQQLHSVPGRFDHRSDKSVPRPERFGLAHPLRLAPGGALRELMDGAAEAEVNSLHAQAIDRLAPGLDVEARA